MTKSIKKRYKHKCQFCSYEWQGYKENPCECPMCKAYLDRKRYKRKK